jgi:small subunit ribosomal protein S3
MGQKVHPLVLRIGFTKTWLSRWFAKPKDYPRFIAEDFKIRKMIKEKYKQAAISKVIIERVVDRVKVRILTARPGLIIGRHGSDIEKLREDVNTIVKQQVSIDIEEIKTPAIDAQLVAENVALQIVKRVAYRRAVKRSIDQAMMAGAKGIRVACSGRLGGAEMSREETYKQGSLPLSTLRADIDYAIAESLTTYGLIGIKTWIYKGEILGKPKIAEIVATETPAQKPQRQS